MHTFWKPNKIMDHVDRHLQKKVAGAFECCHLVCRAEEVLLNNVVHFKNHVEMVHGIRLRDLKYIS
jgi:hypothetical protein